VEYLRLTYYQMQILLSLIFQLPLLLKKKILLRGYLDMYSSQSDKVISYKKMKLRNCTHYDSQIEEAILYQDEV
jgi:hypothetical protein